VGMTLDQWIDLVCTDLGLGPVDHAAVLELARDVAHAVARPAVRLIVSGDEVVTAGIPPPGRVRDALGPMLPGLVLRLGGLPGPIERLADHREQLISILAAPESPVLVTTGASANGPADHLRPALAAVGADLLVDGVACRPGHPMLLARLPGGAYVVGLPGNPLAALAGTLILLGPLLRALRGLSPERVRTVRLREPLPGHAHDARLVLIREGRATGWAGSAMLRGAAVADGFAIVPSGPGMAAGESVELLSW
jgi:molybdopterin molybdotransferase